jgi:tRNA threonylcarbamoyladenosine biosynthesis protein TsaB
MSLILNIDTSTENASICLARDGHSISALENADQKDHASWIHPAIESLLHQTRCTVHDLEAVAVTAGPGSYTGLRVAMATAKGLCYALKIPLITENTLRVMALAAKQSIEEKIKTENILFCPMIDARRMEVFTALFNPELEELFKSSALVLQHDLFSQYLSTNKIVFSGNGSKKFQQFVSDPNAIFSDFLFSATQLALLADQKFINGEFDDISYAEPLYLKEFYTVPKK